MAQARVTDYFSQSKRAGVERSLRSKGQKNRTAEDPLVTESDISKTKVSRTTRSSNKKVPVTKSTCLLDTQKSLECVQKEFLRVIDEVVSSDHVDCTTDERDSDNHKPIASPRTPKRTLAEAEFDLGSAVFTSVTELHSTAKKRLRVSTANNPCAAPKTLEVEAGKRTARKKLVLSKNKETVTDPQPTLASPAPQVLSQSVEKEPKNLASHGADSSPLNRECVLSSPQQPTSSKKPLSVEDVTALKSRLQRLKGLSEGGVSPVPAPVSTLAELKARLDSARELSARAQQRKAARECAEEKTRGQQAQAQPGPEEREKLPAYERYHTLAQDVPPGLTLPYKYKVLAEMFRSMDTIVGMLFNRSETVTFAKVKQGVQDMMHKRFEETHMGQIKMVYPSAYIFRQEKNIPTFSATAKKSAYQLTVEPVVEEDAVSGRPALSAARLLERRRVFHQNLLEVVKGHHKVFLASLDPPMVVPDDKLTRWHPRFRVDEVPHIQPSELPLPPQMERLTTAQEVLDKARALMTPKMEKALANMALKTAETACSKGAMPEAKSVAPPMPTPPALKGVSQSLLERIRAKEAQKLQAAMMRKPEQEERLTMMARLPEMARILRNVFVAEKKPALIMELACSRMISSYRACLSTAEMEKHLRLLAELAPDWLTVHPIRKDFYLKLNKNVNMNVILEKLTLKIKGQESL